MVECNGCKEVAEGCQERGKDSLSSEPLEEVALLASPFAQSRCAHSVRALGGSHGGITTLHVSRMINPLSSIAQNMVKAWMRSPQRWLPNGSLTRTHPSLLLQFVFFLTLSSSLEMDEQAARDEHKRLRSLEEEKIAKRNAIMEAQERAREAHETLVKKEAQLELARKSRARMVGLSFQWLFV